MPTPQEIRDRTAAIRAGWDERTLLIRSGVEPQAAATRLAGESHSVPVVVVLERRERAVAE